MISLDGLTKRYGAKVAVDDLTMTIRPGAVTGFLGPNGAGKSTTMRMILGLDRPTAGTALVRGTHYADLRHPLRVVGALLDARAVHPGRSVRAAGPSHLDTLARLSPRERQVLEHLAQAYANQAIATRLHVSLSTVEKHIASLGDKLDIPDDTDYNRRVLAILRYLDA